MFRSLSTAVLLLLFALPGLALAQGTGTLAGVVRDAGTGETLPGANVRIEGTTLGAAADIDGNYRIIGVPVGTYSVIASFAGLQSQTVTDVTINNGYTRDLDFALQSETLGEVVVEYTRPLIEDDAIGVPRVVGTEELQNLPLRGVNEVAALQASTVSPEGSGDLFIRGGREQEVEYFVDGVRVNGLIGVGQNAIEEQEMIIGTIPARYGDAQSGIINITTRTGREDFFGNAELLTSQGLDAFGYNLGALALGGPILPGRVGFFLSGQYEDEADASPFFLDTYRLTDEAYQTLLTQPQVLRTVNPTTGETGYVTFPAGVDPSGRTVEQLAPLLDIPEGFELVSGNLVNAAETFTADDFELERSKDDPRTNLSLNGNLNFTPGGSTQIRLGGGYSARDENLYRFGGSLYNPNAYYNQEADSWRTYLTLRQRLGETAFFQLQGDYSDYRFQLSPNGYAGTIDETLFYTDVDAPITDQDYVGASANYFVYRTEDTNGDGAVDGTDAAVYTRLYQEDGAGLPSTAGGLFDLSGRRLLRYQQRHEQQARFTGSLTAQLGIHQLEVGTEFQRETRRFIDINGASLSRFYADGNVEGAAAGLPAGGVTSFYDLPFEAVEPDIVSRYGYTYLGEETDDQDIDAFFRFDANGVRENTDVAPYEPIYYAGYVQDKIEYRDLVLQLGLRVDVFDNNALVLEDIFTPVPIVRVRDQGTGVFPAQVEDFNIPFGVEEDAAVYFNDAGTVVGYRDLDGNFYDREGLRVLSDVVIEDGGGSVVTRTDLPRSAAFQDYEPGVLVMPRVGVSFPVTDRALFFASYNVTGQRPTEFAFAPFTAYEGLTGQDQRTANPTLRPERTTQYEIGFRQRLGENAAVTVSGFVRNQTNKISNRRLTGGFPAYGTYLNSDFTTSKGLELGFDLRRTRNLALTANYTLSYASGTGSDAGATATIVWRGNFFPNTLAPADFDQRHTANVSLDYRFADGEGPLVGGARLLENFGINLLGQFGSGLRYTALEGPSAAFDSFTEPSVGTINSSTLPATARFDLRVDRSFTVARGAAVRAYVTVQNLLDSENVLAVYRATGLPNEDGYLATANGQTYLNQAADRAGREFLYNAYVAGNDNLGGAQSSSGGSFYGAPRRIRLGVLFDF